MIFFSVERVKKNDIKKIKKESKLKAIASEVIAFQRPSQK